MKYRMLKAGEIREKGDQVKTRNGWGNTVMIGTPIPYNSGLRYRRPIPEKKAADAINWESVAKRMRRALGMYTPSGRVIPMEDSERLSIAIGIYTRALARARKGAKGGR